MPPRMRSLIVRHPLERASSKSLEYEHAPSAISQMPYTVLTPGHSGPTLLTTRPSLTGYRELILCIYGWKESLILSHMLRMGAILLEARLPTYVKRLNVKQSNCSARTLPLTASVYTKMTWTLQPCDRWDCCTTLLSRLNAAPNAISPQSCTPDNDCNRMDF